ncbi:aminoacyl-tRNA hydrolase [Candidatus Saccharibacteria bacterium]|nr:aminoacyl-tRNA hydrolase [Candidatus Saccharibacteria bacterium]
MKLIVGLGNPGNQYNFTRHNFGFLTLDFYFKVRGLDWSDKTRFGAVWGKTSEAIFIKPQDFYNASGKAVREYARYYKLTPSDILVICDNFDLEFGKIRQRSSGQAAGNNGLKSIDTELKTTEYPRLRLGTGNDELRRKMGDVDFVLSRFTSEEKSRLPEILATACDKIDDFINS